MSLQFDNKIKKYRLDGSIKKIWNNLPGTIMLISHYSNISTGNVRANLDLLLDLEMVKFKIRKEKKKWYIKNPEFDEGSIDEESIAINERRLVIMRGISWYLRKKVGKENAVDSQIIENYKKNQFFKQAVDQIYDSLFERPIDGSD
jgi:hypothetical protein